jgi:hypothetical protein
LRKLEGSRNDTVGLSREEPAWLAERFAVAKRVREGLCCQKKTPHQMAIARTTIR